MDRYSISEIRSRLSSKVVIPAHPLALLPNKSLDEVSQRALSRYYVESGVTGIAVGVHTTQFEIRSPEFGLLEPVLSLAAQSVTDWSVQHRPLLVAGVCGDTTQAVAEAELAHRLGYDCVLLSLSALRGQSNTMLLDHCQQIARILPVVGFYLQPAVGGMILDIGFWRGFAEIENVVAIKIAPFNRYQTLDVVRAVAEVQRKEAISLLTGNDDNIVMDLTTKYRFGSKTLWFSGGLLGQWAVGTRAAKEMVHRLSDADKTFTHESLSIAANEITDINSALFDARNGFTGCIAGINEVLTRQGLMKSNLCLLDKEQLSHDQAGEIDRVMECYSHWFDGEFIGENKDKWFA